MNGLDVLYEDNHLLIINKPAGVLVQGDETGDEPLVEIAKRYIGKKYNKPGDVFLGVVHRLDRPVSGVVAFARTSKALERMNELFRNRETKKIYWAVLNSKPAKASDHLIHWLEKDEKKNKTTAYRAATPHGQRSELHYTIIAGEDNTFLAEVNPITGRPHQIRVQLATTGCPIAGDLKYGAKTPLDDASIALHARRLEFLHPVKKEQLVITAPLPGYRIWDPYRRLTEKD